MTEDEIIQVLRRKWYATVLSHPEKVERRKETRRAWRRSLSPEQRRVERAGKSVRL